MSGRGEGLVSAPVFTLLDKHKRYSIHSMDAFGQQLNRQKQSESTNTCMQHTHRHHTHTATTHIQAAHTRLDTGHEIILKRPQNDFIQLKCQNAVCFPYLMQ